MATAEEAAQQALEIGPSGEAYLDSVRYRSVQTDVAYFDPTRAIPPLETGQEPTASEDRSTEGDGWSLSGDGNVIVLVAVVTFIALVLLVWRSSGSFALSLQGDAPNPARSRQKDAARAIAKAGQMADLQVILATADRRQALVMLAQAALSRTVVANGVLLQPSWTMRDMLRRIPKGQAHLEALRSLVLAGEWVLFGDRAVTEAEFQAHLSTIRPLMAESAT